MPLMLASPEFAQGGQIPTEYTCDGADISPALSWSGAPPGTRSLVLEERPRCGCRDGNLRHRRAPAVDATISIHD
ncbi:MAG TPA: hypothetical protein VMS01_16735 [Stellaceae bacterium]|jgi:hypothetical protein|nr:hypothetical protein [Stellaceae bacterium]